MNSHFPKPTCLKCISCLGLRFNGLSAVATSTKIQNLPAQKMGEKRDILSSSF